VSAGPVGSARILERGYRSYDGPRTGVRGAMVSLTRHSVQRVLGLKRTFWNKILPFGAIFLAYVPAIVFVGAAVFLKDRFANRGLDVSEIIPSYGVYYQYVWAAIFVFGAFAAPEVLCTDRRTGMLGLYLASPLRRDTYLIAKGAAVGLVLGLVTLGPPLLMLVARTIAGVGPDGLTGFVSILWRVVVGGVIVATLLAAVSLAIASTTSRRAAASAAFILVTIGSWVITEALISAGASANLFVADLLFLPLELVGRLFGELPGQILPSAATVPTANLIVAYLLITVALLAFVRFRYQRIRVTR